MGTYNVAGPNFGRKDQETTLISEQAKRVAGIRGKAWQGQTLEGTTFLSKQSVAGVRGKARVV